MHGVKIEFVESTNRATTESVETDNNGVVESTTVKAELIICRIYTTGAQNNKSVESTTTTRAKTTAQKQNKKFSENFENPIDNRKIVCYYIITKGTETQTNRNKNKIK